jgi:hypothetical protein
MPLAECRKAALILTCFAAGLLTCQSALAQSGATPALREAQFQRLGVEGEIALGNLGDMQTGLELATPQQAQSLLIRLGVEPEIAQESVQFQAHGPAISLTSLPTMPPSATVAPATEYALLFLPETVQGHAAMYLLSRTARAGHPGVWHRADGSLLDQFCNQVSVELVTLHGARAPLLALHHVNLDHGSNMCEDQTEFFSFTTGKLTEVLHTPDYDFSDKWVPAGETRPEVQRSTFLPLPDGTLEETRLTTLDDQPEQLARRRWRWQAALGQLTPGAFQALQDGSPPSARRHR